MYNSGGFDINHFSQTELSKVKEDSMAASCDETSDSMGKKADPKYHSFQEQGQYLMKWKENFKKPGIKGLLKFIWEGSKALIPDKKVLDETLPLKKTNFLDLNSDKFKSGIWVSWLGHACVLVQIEGVRILTDPVFSSKLGPSMAFHIGPTRYRDAPCSVADLPKIHAVVISHNHYDHLDVQTVRDLNQHQPDLTWLVPKGIAEWMKSTGCRKVVELDWWHKHILENLSFYFVPAQHWSKRGAFDDNKTLWGGWCVLGKAHRFYFAGDTGYDEGLFKEIGRLLGPFDLAAIPIGAYSPRWFMNLHHINPEEAFKIHKDVQAKKSIGIHWATFNLSSEDYLEPREKLCELQQHHTDDKEHHTDDKEHHTADKDDDFFTINLGESKFLDDD